MKKETLKEIKSIKNQLVDKYGAEKIFLIGSAAWGRMKKDSDLDFLVIKKNTPKFGRDRMREARKAVDSDMPVDILVYRPDEFKKRRQMGDPFIFLVCSKGKVLYG